MKKLYKFFNQIELDEAEMVEQAVEEKEVKKAKGKVMASLPTKKKTQKRLRSTAIAALLTVGFSAVALGFVFPTTAGQVPLLGNLFTLFGDNRFNGYHENAKALNLTSESNGTAITLNEAVYDGDLLTVAFKLKTAEELSEWIHTEPIMIDGKQIQHTTFFLEKIDEKEYAGILFALPYEEMKKDTIQVEWDVKELLDHVNEKSLQGDWHFQFTLDRVQAEKMKLKHKLSHDFLQVNALRLEKTAVSFKFIYDVTFKEAAIQQAIVRFNVTDDIGNSYVSMANKTTTLKPEVKFHHTEIYSKLNESATELYFSPEVLVIDEKGRSRWLELDPMTIELKR